MNQLSYKNLIVWQKSLDVTKKLYQLTEKLPASENYNLKIQIRKAAISISSNIAEGSARKTQADQKRFYLIARSSLIEIDSQLESCIALKFFSDKECLDVNGVMIEVFRILSKLAT